MVFWLNKWFLVLFFSPVFMPSSVDTHPFHVGTLEINHNAAEQTLEISSRLFTDDFEFALNKNFKVTSDLSDPKVKEKMEPMVEKYLLAHIRILVDGKQVQPEYLGFEKDGEAVYAYLQVEKMNAPKKIDIADSRLYDLYDDQINIIHVKVNGKRKSVELKYPNQQTSFQY